MKKPCEHIRSTAFVLCLLTSSAVRSQTAFTVGGTTINVVEMATNLVVPWDMVLGPDGWIWFTEYEGRVSRLDPNNGTVELIYTVPDVYAWGFSAGLHSMAFHPDFANQPYVYLHYVTSTTTSVVKHFYYDAGLNTFTSTSPSLLGISWTASASHNGSRMILDDEGMFLLCLGEAMNSPTAQDMAVGNGKVLRFAPDGSIPADNPIPGSYVYNWGHRNPQGMVKAPNGIIYNSAHGQGLDDEVNIILPDRNYGWPNVLGLCDTPAEITYCGANNVVEPIHEFTTEIVAPSGLDYFNHPAIPEWQNSLLVATLKGRELRQLQLNSTGDQVLSDSTYLSGIYGRLRDVLVHPDGRIFICTSNQDWAGVAGPGDDKIIALVSEDISTRVPVNSNSGISVWPNPSPGTFTWAGIPPGRYDAVIIDATGRVAGQTTDLDDDWGEDLAPGTYTVHIRMGDQIMRARVVKE